MNKLVVKDLHKTTELMNKLAQGDLSSAIENNRKDEFGKFYDAMIYVRQSFNELINDANMLSQAAEDGKLSIRSDATKHNGEFAKIIIGMNNTNKRSSRTS